MSLERKGQTNVEEKDPSSTIFLFQYTMEQADVWVSAAKTNIAKHSYSPNKLGHS